MNIEGLFCIQEDVMNGEFQTPNCTFVRYSICIYFYYFDCCVCMYYSYVQVVLRVYIFIYWQ